MLYVVCCVGERDAQQTARSNAETQNNGQETFVLQLVQLFRDYPFKSK